MKETSAAAAVVTGTGGSLGRARARRLAAGGQWSAMTDVDGPRRSKSTVDG